MMDLSNILKNSNISSSSVKVVAKDRRDGEKYVDVTYVTTFSETVIRRELDRYGYDLVSAEVVGTVEGELSLQNLYQAFAIAEDER